MRRLSFYRFQIRPISSSTEFTCRRSCNGCRAFFLPSVVSIAATYALLRSTQRDGLRQQIAKDVPAPVLSLGGKTAALGIAAAAVVLLGASALDVQLGLPTAVAGAITAAVVMIRDRKGPWTMVKDISWGVLPLVAGLFVLVEALNRTGLIAMIIALVHNEAERSATVAAWAPELSLPAPVTS
jgi:arsenical pump membrane protein